MNPNYKAIARHTLAECEVVKLFGVASPRERSSLDAKFIEPFLSTTDGNAVRASELRKRRGNTMVLGGPGAGKTTLLRFLACEDAKEFLSRGDATPIPIFTTAGSLAGALVETAGDLIDAVKLLLTSAGLPGISAPSQESFQKSEIRLYVDGLDEVQPGQPLERITSSLFDSAQRFPQWQLIVSSRPASLSIAFEGFSYFHVEPLNNDQIAHLIEISAGASRAQATEFLTLLTTHQSLSSLSSTPLLLTLLWHIFQRRGELPANRASLFYDFSDYLLRTWDTVRGVVRGERIPPQTKEAFLQQLSLRYVTERRAQLSRSDVLQEAARFTQDRSLHLSQEALVNDLVFTTGILRVDARGDVSFIHKSFSEFYAALAISADPSRVVEFVGEPELHEIVIMACGLTTDVGPIIEAAVQHGEVLLAAKCISNSRTRSQGLADYVMKALLEQVEAPFGEAMATFFGKQSVPSVSHDEHLDLLNLLKEAGAGGLTSGEKGARFERFAVALFEKFFKVVSHDLNTLNGEIDLVVELVKWAPFWSDFGGECLVECKNWAVTIPLKDVGSFSSKADKTRGIKLAFILSMSGFTKDAMETIRIQAADPRKCLIVPIVGEEIKNALMKKDDFEEFFKSSIRRITHFRKT
jgi:hypothetical protein